MTYTAPVKDISFVLNHVVGLSEVASLEGFEDASPDLVEAILDESAKFTGEVLAPLNWAGDQQGSQWDDGVVTTPDGWADAYKQFVENGWGSLSFPPEFGGQGLPMCVSAAVQEMWHSANMSFGLCPLLTQGAVDAIAHHASDELKQQYLPNMVEGTWSGTMNLTEPQAGSDLAAIRTKAEPKGDHYLISGQKIFITYGEHDMTDNIIHLVLAVRCVSIEHKLGIHASPTCVMSFGDNDGAVGYLVGKENHGLMYMFTMMNQARHAVGVEGYGIAERSYQKALEFSRDRRQGQTLLGKDENDQGLECAAAFDKADRHADEDTRERMQRRGELLTPLVKGWSTEMGVELCSLGVQVHGGMGFIEETGAAQFLRDARIAPIYEGTTAIQANDLIGRKTARDGGKGMSELLSDMRQTLEELNKHDEVNLAAISKRFEPALASGEASTQWMLEQNDASLPQPMHSYLMMVLTATISTRNWYWRVTTLSACCH